MSGWAATLLLEVKNRKSSFVRQGPRAVHLWCSARGERDAGKWGPLTCAHFRFRSQIGFIIGAQQKGSKPLKGLVRRAASNSAVPVHKASTQGLRKSLGKLRVYPEKEKNLFRMRLRTLMEPMRKQLQASVGLLRTDLFQLPMKWNTGDSPSKWLIRRVNSQCDASVKWDGDLPELSPVLLKMGANQATLIDRWDRKEEPLIAFAAASFRSIYKQLGAKLSS
ncbi:hypothetical protein KY285_024927 [Solanum tuberosum]|nr:hypothetical protein KY284_032320 [Solanum tuberosum]KAH0671609.1 hypothetical protein KY289_026102 [Solanum tuberosum]KAH0677126.1 hypothetical protein KY285_024927 [Solanum tuberosum]KAH0713195.1 hypothetical protein KY289_009154 [Solanum tuberosum]